MLTRLFKTAERLFQLHLPVRGQVTPFIKATLCEKKHQKRADQANLNCNSCSAKAFTLCLG